MKTGKKGITDQIENAIGLQVDKIMSNPNALAIMASEITGKPTREVTDPEILKTIKDNLTKEYKGMYSTETTKDFDSGQAGYYQGQYEFGYNANKENLHPGLKEITVVKEPGEIELDGKKFMVPAGSKDIAATDFVKGGYEAKKKGVYEGVQKFRVVTGKDGKPRVLALIENFGKDSGRLQESDLNEKGVGHYNKIKKDNPGLGDYEIYEEIKKNHPDAYTVSTDSKKENPTRWMNIGRNQTEFSQYLPNNTTTDDVIRKILKMSGQNPNTAAKGNVTKTGKVKKQKAKSKATEADQYGI